MATRVDLHCHYIPAIDDGVRTLDESVALLRGLRALGFGRVIATPHMRTEMFPNTRASLVSAFERLVAALGDTADLPALGLASEHFFDDVLWERFGRGEVVPYPGGRAMLVELPPRRFPVRLEGALYRMAVQGITPVVAHPERYHPVYRQSGALEPLVAAGALFQLDLMSLEGHYGSKPAQAARRLLDEDQYYIACSDCHRPADVEKVGRAIETLTALVGVDRSRQLLERQPAALVSSPPTDGPDDQ